MTEFEKNYTLYIAANPGQAPANAQDLQKRMESQKESVKEQALQEAILWMLQGELYSRLLMTVIRYIVPCNGHRIKRLLQLYWEVVDKCQPHSTALKEEMILVCNSLLQDLTHPNEYIRGSTLRLLCKVKHFKIIAPLMDAIFQNVTHRHSYVRRNAVMCVYSIVQSFGLEVAPHATEEIEKLLYEETDLSAKRNALSMLTQCASSRALKYVLLVQDAITALGDIFQLAALELIRRVWRQNPEHKATMLKIIISLVEHCPPAIAYEGAMTLVALSSAPAALKPATQAFVSLLCRQADNNIRLIVLDRLTEMAQHENNILESYVVEILRALRSPSLAVRKRTLDLSLRFVSPRTVHDIVTMLRKEILRTMDEDSQSSGSSSVEYRRILIRAVHTASANHPDVVKPVVELLMDFIADTDQVTSSEVLLFVRELVSAYPQLRANVIERMTETIHEIQQSRSLRLVLWCLGEYCETESHSKMAVEAIYNAMLPLPIHPEKGIPDQSKRKSLSSPGPPLGKKDGRDSQPCPPRKVFVTTRTVILPDGTYGAEDVYEDEYPDDDGANEANRKKTPFRNFISGGDSLLASLTAVATTKLVLRYLAPSITDSKQEPPSGEMKTLGYKVLYLLSCLAKFGREKPSAIAPGSADPPAASGVASVVASTPPTQESSAELADLDFRVNQCLRALVSAIKRDGTKMPKLQYPLLQDCRASLSKVLQVEREANLHEAGVTTSAVGSFAPKGAEVDDGIRFRQLREKRTLDVENAEAEGLDLRNALGTAAGSGMEEGELFERRLAKVQQMTGLADPVYVEAFIEVHQFDLLIELLVINRTEEILQNVNVELSTHGDLKLVDRPHSSTLSPGESTKTYASVKVQSTETGIVFGYVTYDKRAASDKEYIVLNELHIDLLDYVQRSWIGEYSFRTMWSEFEWENKININSPICDVSQFLEHIMKSTNMTIVGKFVAKPENKASESENVLDSLNNALLSQSNFFAVNLYSKSAFGEDALANISIERQQDGRLAGSVRIRSRTQGIALSLGDRITMVNRRIQSIKKPPAHASPPQPLNPVDVC